MRTLLKIAMSSIVLLSVSTVIVASSPVIGVRPGAVFVEQENRTVNVEVSIENVSDLAAFQFDVLYNPAVLNVENAESVHLEDFIGGTGRNVSIAGLEIDNSAGVLKIGVFSFGKQKGASGSGSLISIDFEMVGKGHSPIRLKNTVLADSRGNPISTEETTSN